MHKILFSILYIFSLFAILFSIENDAFNALWYVIPVFLYLNVRLYIKYNEYIKYQKCYISSPQKKKQYAEYKPYCSTSTSSNRSVVSTKPQDEYEYGYYPQITKDDANQYDKIGECIQQTNNIVSFRESERVLPQPTVTVQETAINEPRTQDNDWIAVLQSTFLNSQKDDNRIVIDSSNRLTVPITELSTTTTYVSQPKKEEYPKDAILIQNTDKITPYKTKIYNDIIYVLSTVYNNPSDFNTACVAITHIECMENKCLIFINMRTIKDITQFPFAEITNKIQKRLGGELNVLFEPNQSVTLHEYMIATLKEREKSYVGQFKH